MFSCEFWEMFLGNFFVEQLQVIASEKSFTEFNYMSSPIRY